MRSRCYDKNNPSYKNYGGRGIRVCKEWVNDYDRFVSDMGFVPDGMSLDRIDTNKHYTPDNCKWSTVKEQLNNQRRNRVIKHAGKTRTMSQWAEDLGVKVDTLFRRLERMPPAKALKAGKLKEWKHGTRQGYEYHKCRCDLCKEANNKRARQLRAKRTGVTI
jgi:hypothetical protein